MAKPTTTRQVNYKRIAGFWRYYAILTTFFAFMNLYLESTLRFAIMSTTFYIIIAVMVANFINKRITE